MDTLLDVRLRTDRPAPAFGLALGRSGADVVLLADGALTRAPASAALVALEASGALLAWPAVWSAEGESYHALVPDAAALARLLARAPSMRVEGMTPAPARAAAAGLALVALGTKLTQRQLRALQVAIERGYYDIPRRVGMDELARDAGLSRTTMQEHLRKAERAALAELGDTLVAVASLGAGALKRPGRPRAPIA